MWVVLLVAIMRREEVVEIGADPAFTKHKMWHFTAFGFCEQHACKNSMQTGEIVCLCMYVWMDGMMDVGGCVFI